jgi:hypothetical protein
MQKSIGMQLETKRISTNVLELKSYRREPLLVKSLALISSKPRLSGTSQRISQSKISVTAT